MAKRVFQCPGCWSYCLAEDPSPEGWMECDCGEKMTNIDLRDSLPEPPNAEVERVFEAEADARLESIDKHDSGIRPYKPAAMRPAGEGLTREQIAERLSLYRRERAEHGLPAADAALILWLSRLAGEGE